MMPLIPMRRLALGRARPGFNNVWNPWRKKWFLSPRSRAASEPASLGPFLCAILHRRGESILLSCATDRRIMKTGFVAVTSASALRWGRLFWPVARSKQVANATRPPSRMMLGGAVQDRTLQSPGTYLSPHDAHRFTRNLLASAGS